MRGARLTLAFGTLNVALFIFSALDQGCGDKHVAGFDKLLSLE